MAFVFLCFSSSDEKDVTFTLCPYFLTSARRSRVSSIHALRVNYGMVWRWLGLSIIISVHIIYRSVSLSGSQHYPSSWACRASLFGAFPLRGRLARLYRFFLLRNQPHQAIIQRIYLCLLSGTTASPSDPAVLIQKVDVSDLCVHHSNGFLQTLVETLSYEKVPLVLLLRQLSPHAPHEHPDQPRLKPIFLQIDIDLLRQPILTRQNLIQAWILLRARERRDLRLCPNAREEVHDRYLAAEQGGSILWLTGRCQGDTVHVRKVEGGIALE